MGLFGEGGVVQQEPEAAVLPADPRGVERVRRRPLLGLRVALLQHPPARDLQPPARCAALPPHQRRNTPQLIAGI